MNNGLTIWLVGYIPAFIIAAIYLKNNVQYSESKKFDDRCIFATVLFSLASWGLVFAWGINKLKKLTNST